MYTAKQHRGATGGEDGRRVQMGQGTEGDGGAFKIGQGMEEAGVMAETQTQESLFFETPYKQF